MVGLTKKTNNLLKFSVLLLTSVLLSNDVYAAECTTIDSKGNKITVTTLFDWQCSGDNGILSLVATLLNWLAVGVAAAVLIGIVYGAIIYATAAGDESKAKHGIEIIRNAVIALILYALMWSFLQFLIPGGLFSTSP